MAVRAGGPAFKACEVHKSRVRNELDVVDLDLSEGVRAVKWGTQDGVLFSASLCELQKGKSGGSISNSGLLRGLPTE